MRRLFFSLCCLTCAAPSSARVFSSLPKTTEKVVALTFDDGPSLKNTPKVIAILQKHHAPATFFILGENAKRFPKLLGTMAKAGFDLANHSYDHTAFTKLSVTAQKAQLCATNALLHPCQKHIRFFRPPYGSYDAKTIEAANACGLDIVLWSVDSEDWRKPSCKKMIASITKQLHPGAILLFHDIHALTASALESILVAIKAKGYRFVPLSWTPDVKSAAR